MFGRFEEASYIAELNDGATTPAWMTVQQCRSPGPFRQSMQRDCLRLFVVVVVVVAIFLRTAAVQVIIVRQGLHVGIAGRVVDVVLFLLAVRHILIFLPSHHGEIQLSRQYSAGGYRI